MLVVNWRLEYQAQKDQQASFAHADSQMSKFIPLQLFLCFRVTSSHGPELVRRTACESVTGLEADLPSHAYFTDLFQ